MIRLSKLQKTELTAKRGVNVNKSCVSRLSVFVFYISWIRFRFWVRSIPIRRGVSQRSPWFSALHGPRDVNQTALRRQSK